MHVSQLETLDLAVLEAINGAWTHPWADVFFVWLTDPPHREIYFVVAALALIVFGGPRGRTVALTLGVAILLVDQISAEVVKPAVERMRPCFAHPDEVRLLLERQARSPSFPSNHAGNAAAFAVVMFGMGRTVGWVATVLAVLIAYSRPYVGVHYPGDVLAGAALGTAVAGATVWTRDGVLRLWRRRASREETGDDPESGTEPPPDPARTNSETENETEHESDLRDADACGDDPSSPDRPARPKAARSRRRAGP